LIDLPNTKSNLDLLPYLSIEKQKKLAHENSRLNGLQSSLGLKGSLPLMAFFTMSNARYASQLIGSLANLLPCGLG
jgi:hypothetical protein